VTGYRFDPKKIVERSRKVASSSATASPPDEEEQDHRVRRHGQAGGRRQGGGRDEDKATRRYKAQEHHPGDRRARAPAAGARAGRQAGLELPRSHGAATMPKSLLVIGSGAIGIEFASFYRTMGAEVTVV
jgi:NADPH-dependent 2,4-dienoyl-CoA reductase/sulfur reductase-like enzyme